MSGIIKFLFLTDFFVIYSPTEVFNICCGAVLLFIKPPPFALEASESQIAGLDACTRAVSLCMTYIDRFQRASSVGHS